MYHKTLESDIIQPHEKIKPYVDIGLSIVISDFLLTCNYTTSRIESFVYRLIESQNFNSIYQGFNISSKHKLFVDTSINKAIKIGIHRPAAFKVLISLINKTNYLTMYKRKDEMRFYMDKQNVAYVESDSIITKVALKALSYANDSIYTKIWFENPDLAFVETFDKNIEKEKVEILFSKLWYINDISYFYLMYLLLPLKTLNVENKTKLFRSHLQYLIKFCIYCKKAESGKFNQDLFEIESSESAIENYDIIVNNKVPEAEDIETDFKNTSTFAKIPRFSKQTGNQRCNYPENSQINGDAVINRSRCTSANIKREHTSNEREKVKNLKFDDEENFNQNLDVPCYKPRTYIYVDTCSFDINQDFSEISPFIVEKRYILLNKLLSTYLLSNETDSYCEILANSIDNLEIDVDKELTNILFNFLLLFSSNSEISYIIFGDKNIFRYKVTKNRLEIFHSKHTEKIEIESPDSSALSFFRSTDSIECDVSGMPYVKVYIRYNSALFEKFIYLH